MVINNFQIRAWVNAHFVEQYLCAQVWRDLGVVDRCDQR